MIRTMGNEYMRMGCYLFGLAYRGGPDGPVVEDVQVFFLLR